AKLDEKPVIEPAALLPSPSVLRIVGEVGEKLGCPLVGHGLYIFEKSGLNKLTVYRHQTASGGRLQALAIAFLVHIEHPYTVLFPNILEVQLGDFAKSGTCIDAYERGPFLIWFRNQP